MFSRQVACQPYYTGHCFSRECGWTSLIMVGLACGLILNSQGALLITPAQLSRTASGDSTAPVVSRDGRFVFFTSTADDLATNDFNRGAFDIFRRNVTNGALTLVSVSISGASGNGRSHSPSPSADGGNVAFVSEASDLVPNDTNGLADIFIRDLLSGNTRLISRARNGAGANGASDAPILSPDGRYVFFESSASNLLAAGTSGTTSLFRTEIDTGETILVSPEDSVTQIAAGVASQQLDLSNDSRRAVFIRRGTSLVPRLNVPQSDAYFRDFNTGQMHRIGNASSGSNSFVSSFRPVLSSDGGVAALSSAVHGPEGRTGGVYRVELPNGPLTLIAPQLNTLFANRQHIIPGPVLSEDGNRIFFEGAAPGLSNDAPQAVYAWEAATQQLALLSTHLVTVADSPQLQPYGQLAGASANARFAAWLGYATDPVPFPNDLPLQLFVTDVDSGHTRAVTRTPSGVFSTNSADFPAVSFSANGQILAFQSATPDLAVGDLNWASDVFLYDWAADRLELISRRHEAVAGQTGAGLSWASANSISADGERVVFISSVDLNGLPGLSGIPNVFVREVGSGRNQLVSVDWESNRGANGSCSQAVISADGRWVAFTSIASNLSSNDTNRVQNVFLRDLESGRTILLSRNNNDAAANAESYDPALAPDGSRIAFVSRASDLHPSTLNHSNRVQNVFAFDPASGTTQLVSAAPDGAPGNGNSYHPVFSPNGGWIAFESQASNLATGGQATGPQVYAKELASGAIRRLSGISFQAGRSPREIAFSGDSSVVVFSTPQGLRSALALHHFASNATFTIVTNVNAGSPTLNHDGSRVAYLAEGAGLTRQVAVLDRVEGWSNIVSLAPGSPEPANGRCFAPIITPDGRFVLFASPASNLALGDTNSATDIFVRDLQTATTLLLSVNALGVGAGDDDSSAPILGPDGRTVIFSSFASDRISGDFNQQADLFLVRLPGSESDFRVLSITRLGDAQTTLVWASEPGAEYRVEFTDVLGAAWQPLDATVQRTGSQATAIDPRAAGSSRFYRIARTNADNNPAASAEANRSHR